MQDVEFTVEEGRLYLLQTRDAKRPAQAAVRFARDAVAEGLLSKREALATIDAGSLDALLHPTFDPAQSYEPLTSGIAASPGAAKGAIVFSAPEAVRRGAEGDDVILVRPFTEADDVAGFHAARGILTSEGGKSSHAALVARGMGRPCVCAVADLEVDLERRLVRVGDIELEAGAPIAIDGSTGVVTLDDVELITPEISDDFEQILAWADEIRRLRVRANADNPEDAARARSFGAEGIGLCRTEHMFFGEDREGLVKEMFLAAERWRRALLHDDDAGRSGGGDDRHAAEHEFRVALERLGALQRRDFAGIFRAMTGMPVTIRLLDPPLHEFLPVDHFEAELESLGSDAPEAELERARMRLALAQDLREANPMLGMRGVRLGIVFPPLYEMQVRAIVAAALEVAASGDPPELEIMLPLIAYETELAALREVGRERGERGDERQRRDDRVSRRHDDRAAAGLPDRRPDRNPRGLLQLRHQRPHPDGDRLLARRRRARLSDHLPDPRVDRREPVRDDRRARSGRADAARGRARAGRQPGARARRMRRARGRPAEHRVLRTGRARLRQLLALPGPDRARRVRPGDGGVTAAHGA